jgi:alkylhydroperoxidase family enzyme
MKLAVPRVPPLAESEWDDDTRETLESLRRNGQVYNIFATLARHPGLMKRWMVFASHILGKSTLPARDREIIILRAGWLCQAEYEWGHHVAIARKEGISQPEIDRVKQGPGATGWSQHESALLKAVDELHTDAFISNSTWESVASRYNTEQMMDLIFTAGQYHLVSMALNSLGVQLEAGFDGFEE